MFLTFIEMAVALFLIWFIQTMRVFDYIFKGKFLVELRRCDICLGFWVYFSLFFVFRIGLLDMFPQTLYSLIMNAVITSAILSVLTFIFKKGYINIFGVTVVN